MLALRASLAQRQTLSTRQELAQSLSLGLRDFRRGSGCSDEHLIAAALTAAAESAGVPALADFASDAEFVRAIREHAEAVAKPAPRAWDDVAATYVFRLQFGESSGLLVTEDSPNPREVSLADFRAALRSPESLAAQLDLLEVSVREQSAYEGALEERRRLLAAQESAAALGEVVESVASCGKLLARQRPSAHEPRFLEVACRKILLVDLFAPLYSHAFLARFVRRFRTLGQRKTYQRTALLNILGEYVLIGFGILAPSVFRLYRWRLSEPARAELLRQLKALGVSEDDVLGDHLRPQYCNRWALAGRPLNARSDDAVLGFITKLVRADAEKIFAAFDFEDFLNRLSNVHFAADTPSEGKLAMCNLLVELLESPEVAGVLIECAATTWHPALREFMQ